MKSTKNKLLSSIATLCVCFAMLIGSTYAWFTDSASTGVNKIQAGNLDVEIVSPGTDTVLTNLEWKKATGAQAEDVLWEPGVSYKLTTFEVKNVGNLALKFKMNISVGSETESQTGEKLSNVISWKMYSNDTITGDESIDIYSDFNKDTVYNLDKGKSKKFSILAYMDTAAGNAYKGLSMDSITVDVIAAQNTVENDSFGDQYDVNASYPVVTVASVIVGSDKKVTSPVTVSTAEKVSGTTSPVATVTVPAGVKMEDGKSTITTSITQTSVPSSMASNISVTSDSKTFEVKADGIAADNQTNGMPLTIKAYIGEQLTNVVLYHNSTRMNDVGTSGSLSIDQDYQYDPSSGFVTFLSSYFSPFTATYDKDTWNNHVAETLSTDNEGCYLIGTAEELALFAKMVNQGSTFEGNTVVLTSNIDLGEYLWTPIGPNADDSKKFKGTFYGQNHVIYNLYVKQNAGYHAAGLFGALNGTVTNLTIDSANIENLSTSNSEGATDNGTAVVAGSIYQSGTISKVTVKNATVKGNRYVGGIAGYVYGNVTN